jgi:hypothetical protein
LRGFGAEAWGGALLLAKVLSLAKVAQTRTSSLRSEEHRNETEEDAQRHQTEEFEQLAPVEFRVGKGKEHFLPERLADAPTVLDEQRERTANPDDERQGEEENLGRRHVRSLGLISVPKARIELATRGFSGRAEATASDVPTHLAGEGGTSPDAMAHHGPPPAAPLGPVSAHPADAPDEVEIALGRAIALASEAGEWATVTELGRELAARRHARTAPSVPSIEAERAKRTGKG